MGDGKREVVAWAITHAPRGQKGGPYEAARGGYGVAAASLDDAARWRGGRPRKWTMRNIRKVVPHARVIRIVRKARPSEAPAMLETARRRLAAVAEHMTEHAYQELASALEVDACRVGPSEASAVEVLREARIVLALCTTGRHVRSAPEYAIVRRIGSEMGYGALMSAASASWAEMFDGTPQRGAQHTCGPAECTVQRTLAAIDRVLAASGPDPSEVVRAAMRYLDHGPDGRLGPAWVGFREACEAYREAGGK